MKPSKGALNSPDQIDIHDDRNLDVGSNLSSRRSLMTTQTRNS